MKFLGVLVLLIGQIAAAQTVVPLFRDNSLKTYVTMPFRLEDDDSAAISIVSIDITSNKSNCQGMIDPMITSNFLVKCTQPDDLSVAVYFKNSSGSLVRINYGPLEVTKISETTTVLVPDTGDPDKYKAGRLLYDSKCLGCHQSYYDKPNRSVTQIKSAITNIGRMKSIKLTDAEVKSISDFLNNLD